MKLPTATGNFINTVLLLGFFLPFKLAAMSAPQRRFYKAPYMYIAEKAVNREDKRSRRYRDRHFAKFERSRRYRDR